jgi:autophagy-related protein 11
VIDEEEQAYHELVEELHISREANARQNSVFQCNALQFEICRLKLSLQDVDSSAFSEQDRAARLKREFVLSWKGKLPHIGSWKRETASCKRISSLKLEQVQSEFNQMKELVSQNESNRDVLQQFMQHLYLLHPL